MSAAAPSLEELLSGVSRKTADAPGGGPGRLGPPPEEEENVRHAKKHRREPGTWLYDLTCPHTQFDEVEETVIERLVGLTEMVPDPLWNVGEKGLRWSVWMVRRSAWVLGTSLALLALPPFIEQQRLEYEEMQNLQKKQVSVARILLFA